MSPTHPPAAEPVDQETCEADADDLAALEEAERALDRGEGLDAFDLLARLRARP